MNGEPGGLVSVDKFLRTWVPRITSSPAFRKDGILIITIDESDTTDATGCCGEKSLPDGPKPGRHGRGGDRIGALVLSRFVKSGPVSDQPRHHYSTLRSVEQWFGLPYPGYAQSESVPVFGPDVFIVWSSIERIDGNTAKQHWISAAMSRQTCALDAAPIAQVSSGCTRWRYALTLARHSMNCACPG